MNTQDMETYLTILESLDKSFATQVKRSLELEDTIKKLKNILGLTKERIIYLENHLSPEIYEITAVRMVQDIDKVFKEVSEICDDN